MINKNLTNVLLFRKEILDIEKYEKQFDIALPPIFKSFYTVFEPYFGVEKYKMNDESEIKTFTSTIYSSLDLDNYTFEEDEFAFESFKSLPGLFTFEPSNKDYAKDMLFIANHGYWGGLMVGIGKENSDKIFHNSGTKVVTFIADNIFELLQKMIVVEHEIDGSLIDTKKVYKNWGEDFWRVKEDGELS